jgi:hypothetical protein
MGEVLLDVVVDRAIHVIIVPGFVGESVEGVTSEEQRVKTRST